MLIDHIGHVFPTQTPIAFRLVGRVAFPIYAFMIAQGCVRTRDINKYLMRLVGFALISEVPFDMVFHNGYSTPFIRLFVDFLNDTNVYYTLSLSVLSIAFYKKLEVRFEQSGLIIRAGVAALAVLPSMYLAGPIFGSDYGTYGVALIFLLYVFDPENKTARALIMAGWLGFFYGHYTWQWIRVLGYAPLLFSLTAVLLVSLYNGEQGVKVKWAFYAFYPVHIALLGSLRLLMLKVH